MEEVTGSIPVRPTMVRPNQPAGRNNQMREFCPLLIYLRPAGEPERMVEMKINTNITGWAIIVFWSFGAFYLWRSAIKPRADEPQGKLARSLRIVGAVMVTLLVGYFVGFGLGFYTLPGHH